MLFPKGSYKQTERKPRTRRQCFVSLFFSACPAKFHNGFLVYNNALKEKLLHLDCVVFFHPGFPFSQAHFLIPCTIFNHSFAQGHPLAQARWEVLRALTHHILPASHSFSLPPQTLKIFIRCFSRTMAHL